MRVMGTVFICVLLVLTLLLLVDLSGVAHWAVAQQRAFQNEIAGAVRGLRSGAPGAWVALLAAAAAYGFVHALGPGHGKYLIGGVGLGSDVKARDLLGLALASSLAQAAWAIALVYGGFYLFELSAQGMTHLAEDVLAPASYLAIAAIGVVLIWRGARQFTQTTRAAPAASPVYGAAGHDHDPGQNHGHHMHHTHDQAHHHHHHDEACGCGGHGPTVEDMRKLRSARDALVLIASIAVRPCTGAIFLLVIAWQMDLLLAGAAAVMVMGLGTAGLTSLVAISSTAARGAAVLSTGRFAQVEMAMPVLQMIVGMLVVWASALLLGWSGAF